ncbi:MAG: 30S ribosomal protein S17 [Proteobacteria bacterium]|nr:30S ribosomal protein S17 [Pseudomonadota bacterium]
MPRRILQGVVVSDCNEKTITVRVENNVKHPVYKKYIRRSKKYAAHDPQNSYKVGDIVKIIECAPISKNKKWHILTEEYAQSIGLAGGKQ